MKKKLLAFILFVTILAGSLPITSEAATLKIKYNGTVYYYTGKQLKLKINGSSKSISKNPGLIMGSAGYGMLPYEDTFVDSKLNMKGSYSSSKKTITLTYNSDKLVMTVGKKTANFNGKSVSLPIAPVSVYYYHSKVTKILVPSRKVAELFGLEYDYSSSTKTISIAKGDSSSTTSNSVPTSYYVDGKKYSINERFLSYEGKEIDLKKTPALLHSGYNYLPVEEALEKNGPKISYSYNSSSKKITLISTVDDNDIKLVMTLNSKKATLNGTSITLKKAPIAISFSKNGEKIVYVPAKVVGPLLGLAYDYSSKKINYTPGLLVKQSGEYSVYTRAKITVNVNGTKISSKMPGLLEENTALIPANASSKSKHNTGLSYSYSNKTATMKRNGITIVMKRDSKTATINGVQKIMPVPMRTIQLVSNGTTYCMIPGEFVMEALGLEYKYSKTTSNGVTKGTATITSPKEDTDKEINTDIPKKVPTVFYKDNKEYTISKREVSYNGSDITLKYTPAFVIDDYNYIPYNEVFVKNGPKMKATYNASTKKLTLISTVDDNYNELILTVGSTKAVLNGKSVTLKKPPVLIKFNKNGGEFLYLPAKVVAPYLGLSYSYSSSDKTMDFKPGLSIRYVNEYAVYTRAKVDIKVNGKEVATPIPGIIEENTTLIPAYYVFQSTYGTDTTYSYSGNKATFKRGDTTIVLTIDSKVAKVNGVSKTMTVPARMITLVSNNSNYVMVPGEFVCETLGLSYKYSKSTSNGVTRGLSTIKSPEPSADNDDTNNSNTVSPDNNIDFKPTITLNRPSSVSKGAIVCTDDYMDKQLVITMSGNYKSYYTSNPPSLPSGVSFSASYSSSSNKTTLTFTTSEINGFRIKEDSSKIYIMNGKPTEIFKNVIVLDAGHGGTDSGATGNGLKEKDLTLAIVKAAKSYFDDNSDYKVYYTRLTDTYIGINDRYKLGNAVNADMFLSVHINSYTTDSAGGTETLYNANKNQTSAAGLSSKQFATILQSYIQDATGFKDRGITNRTNLGVLTYSKGPAVLTEVGFISNKTEAESMNNNVNAYGKAIYNAVLYAAKNYPSGRFDKVEDTFIEDASIVYTDYNATKQEYAELQYNELSSSAQKTYTLDDVLDRLTASSDINTRNQFLRLDSYRPIDTTVMNNMISSTSSGKSGVLANQASAFDAAAKKYDIDPFAFCIQSILETGWGTSDLAKGITSNQVIKLDESKSGITFLKDDDGNYVLEDLDKETTAYNLFGIKAYDGEWKDLTAFSYAYYKGWTTIEKAIDGGAEFISSNYINSTKYEQNTFFKYRFNPNITYIWHQYSSSLDYSIKLANMFTTYLNKYEDIYTDKAVFLYDFPRFDE